MTIERTTIEEMRCSMGGCSNTVRDLGMREGEGVYTIEEIAIDAGWKIEEFNGKAVHVCPRCSSDRDSLRAEISARDEVITELLAMLKPVDGDDNVQTSESALHYNIAARQYVRACEIAGRAE